MEFVTLPRRSPRFPHPPPTSTSLSTPHSVPQNVAGNATAVAGSPQSFAPTHPSCSTQQQHIEEDPIPSSRATAPSIPLNKKRPRLTLDLPNIPNTPTGLSPRDIRALKRRKLLHPGSPTPSAPSSPTMTNSNAIAGPSNVTPNSSPLTSPISAISTPRSSTPPPPPSIPPLIQPTSANAVRPERRKKLGFESSPLSRNSTTPLSDSLPAPSTRHGYALRSAPAQVAEPAVVEDVKGKGKEKAVDVKAAVTGSKRRRKENSAALANGPTNKRLRSNSTPASLTSLPTTTARSRRGIPRLPAPAPSSIPPLSKGKGKASELPPASPMAEDPPPVKRPSIRSLRSNSTVSININLAPPPAHRRTRSKGSNPDETPDVGKRPTTPTRGRGRGGKAKTGAGSRKRVDVIDASPKSSPQKDREARDVPEMSLSSPVFPRPSSLSPRKACITLSPLSPIGSLPELTPSPPPTPTLAAPLRPSTPESTTTAVESSQDLDEARTVQSAPSKVEEPTSSPESIVVPSVSSTVEASPPPTSSLFAPATPSTPATEAPIPDIVSSLSSPAPQRPPLRLRIPGEENAESTQQLSNESSWEMYMNAREQQQQQLLPEQPNAPSFPLEQPQIPQQSPEPMIQDPTMSMPMDPTPVSQPMVYHQPSQEVYTDQDPSTYQQTLTQEQYAMDSYQQQLAQQQHQQQMAQQQQIQQVPRRPTAPGLWEVACKIRVCELERRYSWITIRDLVTQEAAEYAMRHGMPRSWWRVTHPLAQSSSRTSSPSSTPANLPSMMSPPEAALKSSTPLPDLQEEDDGEDWSDYESEFSDIENDGQISRESSKGNSPVDSGIEARDTSRSPSISPKRRKRKMATSTTADETTFNVPALPIPLDFTATVDEAAAKRRRSWPGEFSYDEDIDMDDTDDSDDEEDEDADAEGEIDPDAWHDPSFQVVAQPVDMDEEVEDNEDKENAVVPAKDAHEGDQQTAEPAKKEKRMKTPVVEVGGTMSAFYVPPLPPSPPTTTASLPSPPPQQHQELGPGLDVLIGGENQDADMSPARQGSPDTEYFAPATNDVANLSPTSPSSPVSFNAGAYDSNSQVAENGAADMFAQSSSAMSPSAYIPNMNMMYESTLPVPAPRLATIRVHALRSVEVGRVVVGKGTPVDRRRVMAWANAGSPVMDTMRLDDIEADERVGFFRPVVSKDENARKNIGSSPGSGVEYGGDMTAPIASGVTDVDMTAVSHAQPALPFDSDSGIWDSFLLDMKGDGNSVGLSVDGGSSSSGIINTNLRSEPERPFEPAPPPLPPSPSTPLCTPPASPLSTIPLSSPAVLGFQGADPSMYYGGNPGSASPLPSNGPGFHNPSMSAPSMHVNSAAAAAADFGMGMFGMGFNMGVGVGVGIGIAVGAAGVASGMVNIPPPTQAPVSPTSPTPMGGWAPPPPPTNDYDQQGQLQQGAFGMSIPGDIFGEQPGSYGGFGMGGSSTLNFALG